MFFHLPERIYGYIKDDEDIKQLEDELREKNSSSLAYTAEKVENENEILRSLMRAIMKTLKGAPDEIVREFRIMMRCEDIEYLKKCLNTDFDLENRLCACYELVSCTANTKDYMNHFLYLYGKANMTAKKRMSATMHKAYFMYKGQAIISTSLNAKDAIRKLLQLRRSILEIQCEYHDKLEKQTVSEMFGHLANVYSKFRETISWDDTCKIAEMCLQTKSWSEKQYEDLWIGNFRTCSIFLSILSDCLTRDASQEKIELAKNILASYIVSAFTDRKATIKSLTSSNDDFRAMYLVLTAGCIRLLGAVDKDFTETSVISLMNDEEKELILAPMKNTDSMTPVTDKICASIGYENENTNVVKAFELELRKEFIFLQQFLVDEKE